MRQSHAACEKLFVDWAGDTIAVFDSATGAEHRARIFVAALGASNYIYAEARWTEALRIGSGPCQRFGSHRRRAESAGAQKSESGRDQAVTVRAGHPSQLSRPGRSLRLCGAADADY